MSVPLADSVAWPRRSVAWWAVLLLALANALSFVARTILSLLVDAVKADLHVSDVAISLLHGFSFAVIFAVIGLPISLLADRGNRRNIIAWSIFVWSVMTAFCGAARSYPVLLIGRLGAGAGEGGFGPASTAILSDFFPRDRLPVAMAIYTMGIYAGSGCALMLGGWVVQWAASAGPISLPLIGAVAGWQLAFILVGLPGIPLALLFLTIAEPARHERVGALVSDRVSFTEIRRHLGVRRLAYIGLIGGFSLHVLVGLGAAAWTPALLVRHFGMSPLGIGVSYGSVFLGCGLLGSLGGGLAGQSLARRGLVSANAWVAFVGYGIEVFFGMGYAGASSLTLAFICIAGTNLFSAAAVGAGFATLNDITPNRMRAQIGAVFLFAINLIGAGLGPTIVALLAEDWFTGSDALAKSIGLTSAVAGVPAVLLLWMLIKSYPTEGAS